MSLEREQPEWCTPCSRGPAERMLKKDAPDPGSYPVNTAGAAGPGFFCAFGPVPVRHQSKDGGGPLLVRRPSPAAGGQINPYVTRERTISND
jgi:hypothetical protein